MSVVLHREKNRYGAVLAANVVSKVFPSECRIISINTEDDWFNIWIEVDNTFDEEVVITRIRKEREKSRIAGLRSG